MTIILINKIKMKKLYSFNDTTKYPALFPGQANIIFCVTILFDNAN